ncbi:MAG: ATP-binding cassette domain-containing protein [Hyphomicrobiaceae bacterium]|nr:ATP-binding cassette domain-containing protein [Hyphomicrobiaceae bacterium]
MTTDKHDRPRGSDATIQELQARLNAFMSRGGAKAPGGGPTDFASERLHQKYGALIDPVHISRRMPEVGLAGAVHAIAHVLGVQASPLPEATGSRLSLDLLCRHYRLIARQVEISATTLSADGGPLLAFLRATGEPVVLLPKRWRDGYDRLDGITGKRLALDGQAADLLDKGFALTPMLPDAKVPLLTLATTGLLASRRDMALVLIIAMISAGLAVAVPYLIGTMLGTLVPNHEPGLLVQAGLALSLLGLVTYVSDRCGQLAALRVQGRQAAVLIPALWERLLRQTPAFYSKYASADLAAKMEVAESFQQSSITLVRTIVHQAPGLIASLGVMFAISPRAGAIAVLLVALLFGLSALGVFLQRRAIKEGNAFSGNVFSIPFELIGGIRKLRAAGAEERGFKRWANSFAELKLRSSQARRTSKMFGAAIEGSDAIFTALVLAAITLEWHAGAAGLGLGAVMAYIAAAGNMTIAARSIARSILSIAPMIGQSKRIAPLLEEVPPPSGGLQRRDALTGEVAVNELTCGYDEDTPVLHDVSFSVPAGGSIGIVGPSGAGKSTLIAALLGLLEPMSGDIRYDGCDLDNLDHRWLRNRVGLVTQDASLFPGSILENVRGSTNADEDTVWEAVRMAAVAETIEAMPMGLQTCITEGSHVLSGGEQQRIVLARALVRSPDLLILDEATSALDEAAQASVMATLEGLGLTRIIVAHRLSTVRHCDRIVVLSEGRVIQQGTYDELISTSGWFAESVRAAA